MNNSRWQFREGINHLLSKHIAGTENFVIELWNILDNFIFSLINYGFFMPWTISGLIVQRDHEKFIKRNLALVKSLPPSDRAALDVTTFGFNDQQYKIYFKMFDDLLTYHHKIFFGGELASSKMEVITPAMNEIIKLLAKEHVKVDKNNFEVDDDYLALRHTHGTIAQLNIGKSLDEVIITIEKRLDELLKASEKTIRMQDEEEGKRVVSELKKTIEKYPEDKRETFALVIKNRVSFYQELCKASQKFFIQNIDYSCSLISWYLISAFGKDDSLLNRFTENDFSISNYIKNKG